jgi:histidyl-tRNA synthetase
MNMKFTNPRGTADILPDAVFSWQQLEAAARRICGLFGYREIRTPLFEETELFARSMGQTSDIVQKQMLSLAKPFEATAFSFDPCGQPVSDQAPAAYITTEKENTLTLRPEGTASVVRAYIQNDLDKKEAFSKLFYIGPMFRGERPQKGRLRQFHQIGVEAIGPGSASPYLDAELMALSVKMLKDMGLEESQFKLKLNTLGSGQDKEHFSQFLRQQLRPEVVQLCEDCQQRFERNVFRILDCKNKNCKETVASLKIDHSYLAEESQKYFMNVCAALDSLNIKYEIDLSLVRGLDYYTHTVFEISCPLLGSQDALGAGGRYNDLVPQLGGPAVDAIGFALGMERILLALESTTPWIEDISLDAYCIALDEVSWKKIFVVMHHLRDAGVVADMGYRPASMKSQMRLADKRKARYVIILGEEELKKGVITVKNMQEGTQHQCDICDKDKMVEILKKGKVD